MNNIVSFRNRGLIDLRAVRTFGVSSKECDNPIGFFGTGLKYAIAICLRLGCKITLWRGLERVEFSTSDVAIRTGSFRVVTMNDEEIGFTTDLGKTWEPWQAFRELYCNAIDEGGEVSHQRLEPQEDFTTIVVTGDQIYSAYLERAQIVLSVTPWHSTDRLHVHDRPTEYGYYRGIRAGKLEYPSVMTYNVLSNLDLTEDRTLKNIYQFYSAVRHAVLQSDNEEFLVKFLCAPTGSFESRLDLDCWVTPAENFLSVIERLSFKLCTNPTALALYKKHRKTAISPDSVPLNRIEQMQLDRAIQFVTWGGYPVSDYPIVVTSDLDDHIWGQAYEGKIYLNRSAFACGTKIIAGTLIEEYTHLRWHLKDESRDLQNHLLNALVTMMELAKGEPL